jgi:hypothetical protein
MSYNKAAEEATDEAAAVVAGAAEARDLTLV